MSPLGSCCVSTDTQDFQQPIPVASSGLEATRQKRVSRCREPVKPDQYQRLPSEPPRGFLPELPPRYCFLLPGKKYDTSATAAAAAAALSSAPVVQFTRRSITRASTPSEATGPLLLRKNLCTVSSSEVLSALSGELCTENDLHSRFGSTLL